MKRWLLILAAALSLGGCGYNDFQRLDEQSKAAWSEVLNQYQRRADLVPNIVATVKGEANFEQETLTRVIEARAKATSIQVTPATMCSQRSSWKWTIGVPWAAISTSTSGSFIWSRKRSKALRLHNRKGLA